MNAICHIVGAGDFSPKDFHPKEGDFIIAADGGLRSLEENGFSADLFIGDGDSLSFLPKHLPSLVLPAVKDDTDLVAAAKEGLKRGFSSFRFYGALGGKRFSHSLANMALLSFLDAQGARGVLVDENCTVTYLPQGEYTLDLEGGYFSLFAAKDRACLSISKARYPLKFATLTPEFPLGVSNEGEKETCISVHEGSLFLIREP